MEIQFSRLAPFIREYIYEKKWYALKDIQEKAIAEVLSGDGHILIGAGTASGKTEACFFPVISMLCENRPSSVGALYIGPLKALINDQAQRLSSLMEQAALPLWRWHGDVSSHHKKSLLENPSGVLQITPESLEALLLRSPGMIRAMFGSLSFVIIDEVHAFMGSERGGQVLCQLARIEEAALCRPRRIGLSATLGDYARAMEWLRRGSSRVISGSSATLIREGRNRRRIRIAVDHFAGSGAQEQSYYETLYREVLGRRSIIFTNSRIEAEETIAAMKDIAARRRDKDRFFVHHGSISASLRTETERELRDSSAPVTVAATATLELGIDIGKLDRVVQIGPPLSVSAFVQRLGRSGRLRGRPEIYFTSVEESGLPWGLIKTIAIIELYLKDQWIEQGEENPLPYSLLVHQTLSAVCSLGGHSPAALRGRILSLPAFANFSEDDFDEVMNHLISLDLLEKTQEGEIIAGIEAGHLTSHYSFYSVFADTGEYRVLCEGREIGCINYIPPEGVNIVLAGRYWKVDLVIRREREIIVSAGEAGSRKLWTGSGADLHKTVAARMLRVLAEKTVYPYLSARARTSLAQAGKLAKAMSIGKDIFVTAREEPQSFAIFPWLGSRGIRTLILILQNSDYRKTLGIQSISKENDLSVNITSTLAIPRFRKALAEILQGHSTTESLYPLIDPAKIPLTGKFDPYLPNHALVRQYAAAMLDAEEVSALFSSPE